MWHNDYLMHANELIRLLIIYSNLSLTIAAMQNSKRCSQTNVDTFILENQILVLSRIHPIIAKKYFEPIVEKFIRNIYSLN